MFTFIQSHVTAVVTTIVLISNILFVIGIILMFLEEKFRRWVYDFVGKYVLELLFTFSLAALVGSLSYSQIVGFPPCELCWVQRIFMYPQIVLSLIAIWKKDKGAILYMLGLSILGAIVAFYHSLIHWGFNSSVLKCSAVGAPCAKVYVLSYGYITIPFMSFTAFAFLIAISVIYYRSRNAR